MEPDINSKSQTLYCSFCGKSQHEVNRLIAGPTVFICDECVDLCADIVDEPVQDRITKWAFFARDAMYPSQVLLQRVGLSVEDLFEEVFGQKPTPDLKLPRNIRALLLRIAHVLEPHLTKAQTDEQLAVEERSARAALAAFNQQHAEERAVLTRRIREASARVRARNK